MVYLQYEKLWKVPTKDGKKVNVLDRNACLTEIMRDLWLYWTILGILKAFS